jgi:hypothetical protein
MPKEVDRTYRELVRLAYLILPGKRKRIFRLAMAQRIVDESLPRWAERNPGRAYARARTRVLRRAMLPSWRLQIALGPWLRALPARLPDPALTVALARLDPAARAAYVLLRVESLPRFEVRDVLVAAGVRDARAALDAAEDVPDVPAPSLDLIRGPAVRRGSRVPVAAAAGVTVLLVGGLVMTGTSEPPRRATARHVPDAAAGARTLEAWPARGDLVHDAAFVGRALAAWHRRMSGRPDPRVLFAGRTGDARVVLLYQGDRIARYTDGRHGLETAPSGDASSPLALGSGRYLLPPWVVAAERTPSAAPVTVRDGVTDPVHAPAGCRRAPLLRLRQPDRTQVVAALGGLVLAPVAYRGPFGGTDPGTAGARLWGRLACVTAPPDGPVTSATAWEFWSGKLPNGVQGRWICTRYTFPGGARATGTLLAGATKDYSTGNCAHGPAGAVSGTWWRSGGRWFYLAAASTNLIPKVKGPFGGSEMRDALLVAEGSARKRHPKGKVTLTAKPPLAIRQTVTE